MEQIVIKNLKVFAHHGVLPEEKEKGQYFYVSATLETDLKEAGHSDDLRDTVNYAEVTDLITCMMTGESFNLIETVADLIAKEILITYPAVRKAEVTVSKPDAPIDAQFETVLVTAERMWHTAYLGLGSNLGDRETYISNAINDINLDDNMIIEKQSACIETKPYGVTDQPDFLNCVIRISTLYTPEELLFVINDIESSYGRKRKLHWGPRTIDIDILFYDDIIMHTDRLTLPHPDLHRRDFVLGPLSKIDPWLIHPVLRRSISDLRDDLCLHSSDDNYFDLSGYSEKEELTISSDTRVAYAGVPGAYSEIALRRFFGNEVEAVSVKNFNDIPDMVVSGECEYGIIPLENSSEGFVSGNYDIIRSSGLTMISEIVVDIEHCLLGQENAEASDIKTVYSHVQGIMQCREYVEAHGLETISMSNTAAAAKYVKDSGDINIAAIASERAAEIYGLKILERNINYSSDNSTRFIVVARDKIYLKSSDKISISFVLAHKVGALYSIMGHINRNRLNMTSIESRPSLRKKWEYIFYVTFEGSLSDKNVSKALGEITEDSVDLKVLGTF